MLSTRNLQTNQAKTKHLKKIPCSNLSITTHILMCIQDDAIGRYLAVRVTQKFSNNSRNDKSAPDTKLWQTIWKREILKRLCDFLTTSFPPVFDSYIPRYAPGSIQKTCPHRQRGEDWNGVHRNSRRKFPPTRRVFSNRVELDCDAVCRWRPSGL